MLEIFLVQMEVAPNDKAKNFAKVEALTQGIRMEAGSLEGKANAGLIVLPEMFATGYLPLHPESAAEDFSYDSAGETAHFLHNRPKPSRECFPCLMTARELWQCSRNQMTAMQRRKAQN